MPFSHRDVTITAREVQNPVYCITRPRAICEPPIVIHADIAPICTSLRSDTRFFAAVHPVMILDTALARTLQIVASAPLQAVVTMVMIVVVQVFVSKVVDENVPDLVVRLHLLCQVYDTVFDDVSIDATDVIRLIAPENRIIAVQAVHLELAQLLSFNHLAPVLYESIFDWEVGSKLAVCLVIEVTPILLDLVQVCVPTLLEDVNCVVVRPMSFTVVLGCL